MSRSAPFSAFARYQRQPGARPIGTKISPEEQNGEYESGRVTDGHRTWRIRTARVTPTKPGAFVAVWRRTADGRTEPFHADDDCDGLLVLVEDGPRFGVFAFTREHLAELGITQAPGRPGKRGFRVYPRWCDDLNRQATRTQRAQALAFTDFSNEIPAR